MQADRGAEDARPRHRPEQAARHQAGGPGKPELRRVDRLGPRGDAEAGARLRPVPGHRVADDERHGHRQPARERVPADERPVRRRPGVQRSKVPVEQLRRRGALHRDEHRQRQAKPRHAARHRPDAAAREDRAGAPEEADVGRAERERPRRRLGIERQGVRRPGSAARRRGAARCRSGAPAATDGRGPTPTAESVERRRRSGRREATSRGRAPRPRPIDGRSTASSTATPAQSGTVVQRYEPAKATRVQPIRRRRGTAAAGASERRFGVIVLVLMAVVPRIVVLVALRS